MTRKPRKNRLWQEKLAVFIVAILGLVTWVASHSHAAWSRAPLAPLARLIGIIVVLAFGVMLARYALQHWNDKD